MAGLGVDPNGTADTAIEYSFHRNNSSWYVYESGSSPWQATFSSYPANATAEISLVDGDIIYKLNGTTVRTIATSYTTFYTHFNAYNGGVADDIYVQAPAIQAPIPDGQGIIDHILFLNTVVPR